MNIRVWKTSTCYREDESVPSLMVIGNDINECTGFSFVWIFVLLVGWLLGIVYNEMPTFGRADN